MLVRVSSDCRKWRRSTEPTLPRMILDFTAGNKSGGQLLSELKISDHKKEDCILAALTLVEIYFSVLRSQLIICWDLFIVLPPHFIIMKKYKGCSSERKALRRRLEEFDKLFLGESSLTPVGPVNKNLIKIINVDYCCC